MGSYGEFEGDEILLARLKLGAVDIPAGAIFHKGNEVLLVVRATVESIEFPAGDTPMRVHKSKVIVNKIGEHLTNTMAAVVVDDDQRTELVTWLERTVTARDGGQMRLGDQGPDWLHEDYEQGTVEMGDGPANVVRLKTEGDLPVPLGEGVSMTDEEWEASGGRPDADG